MSSSVFRFRMLLLSMVLFIEGNAQPGASPPGPGDLNSKLLSLDSLFFDAITSCNVEKLNTLFSTSGFEAFGRNGLATSPDKGIRELGKLCDSVKVRRELIRSGVQTCPIADYGGVLTAEQRIYITLPGKKETLAEISKIAELWKQEGNDWKITKLIAYDQHNDKMKTLGSRATSRILDKMDSSLFAIAYKCKPEEFATYFTEDLEFYHDKGGLTKSLPVFMEQLKNNFCGEDKVKLRRELVAGSLHTYDMVGTGAIQEGEHRFYITENGKERVDGIARFIHIWVYDNKVWKISRVLSLDHRPAQ